MATTPPKANLFGGGGSPTTGPLVATSKKDGASTGAAGAASAWFDDDDEVLLSHLLLGDEAGDADLDAKLAGLRGRLEEDLSRPLGDGEGWWKALLRGAEHCGFASRSSSSAAPVASHGSGGGKALPKSFHTPEGKAHVQALVDLLGISKERAVKMTLASLRSFASVGAPAAQKATTKGTDPVTSPSADSDKENDKQEEGEGDENETKLRSLLGTKALFHRVLLRHRRQFLARLRVVTESLRLEQDAEESTAGSVGKSCKAFLDGIDSTWDVNGKKRGVFRMLLALAAGPPLPGMGAGELPSSVDRLRGTAPATVQENIASGAEETLVAIRTEAAEALLVLLYDRVDGGAQRLDLWMVLEAGANCAEYEFGTSAERYATGGMGAPRGGIWPQQRSAMDLDESSSPVAVAAQMKQRLDGLWALICAECMGLWRANGNDDDGDWVKQHPLFSGLNVVAAIEDGGTAAGLGGKRSVGLSLQVGNAANSGNLDQQAQRELEALCHKLRTLGETLCGRRQAAYSSLKGTQGAAGADDELWGVRAPESTALLSLGLLLHLAHTSCPSSEFLTKLGGWGQECAQFANDDCGAFAYLHRVMEQMIVDPLKERRASSGVDTLARDLLRCGEVEMAAGEPSLALTDGRMEDDAEEEELVSDAASVVYASIGREILSSTVRAFRDALLSLQTRSSAVDNIGMLADLASAIYCNQRILCESFWNDWEDFCQSGSDGMNDDEEVNDEPMCYLLDASHTLAVSTLAELKTAGSSRLAIVHYIKPLSTFLRLIASLCASPPMVESVLTSQFLPEGLMASTISVVAALGDALAPLVSSNNSQVSSEERSTIRYATVALESISTLACLGGSQARDQIRQSLSGSTGPRAICNIALRVLPRHQNALKQECTSLASSVLELLEGLLVDASVAFQLEACSSFSFFGGQSFGGGDDRMSGFAPFVAGGVNSKIALGAMAILDILAANLVRNVFDTTAITSGMIPAHFETLGGGVMVALDVLATMVSSGEVSFPVSTLQVATTKAILSSVGATLFALKEVIYLHEDDEIRSLALSIRNDMINSLSSSTPLGQVVAFLAASPISMELTKKAFNSRELAIAMDSAAAAAYRVDNKRDSKYGAWGRFVTPKRALQRDSKRNAASKTSVRLSEDSFVNGKEDTHLELYDVVVASLSLILMWGEHAEDIADNFEAPSEQNVLLQCSPCTLLLSRANGLNVANLDLISRYANVEEALAVGTTADASLLSAKVMKMCMRHTKVANSLSAPGEIGLSTFRVALGGGTHLFKVLLAALDKLVDDDDKSKQVYFEGMEQLVLMTMTMLETLAISISNQQDLARSILLGSEGKEDWRLVDKMVSCVLSTTNLMKAQYDNKGAVDARVPNLHCLLTCAILYVISELWQCCRLACTDNSNNSKSAHPCGSILSHLTNKDKKGGTTTPLVANIVVELTRSSLLASMQLTSQEDGASAEGNVSVGMAEKKVILLDLMTQSLNILAIETMGRVQTTTPPGSIKFVEDLFDTGGPMECWSTLLSSSNATVPAASSWLSSFSSSIGRGSTPNWNVPSFLMSNPAEKDGSISSWCSYGQATRLVKALSPSGSNDVSASFVHCSALHSLATGEAAFAASWATFFEVVTTNVVATRSSKEALSLSSALVENTLAAISSVSDCEMIAESLLSSQGLAERRDTRPIGELCSLLLYALTVRKDAIARGEGDAQSNCKKVLGMIGQLHESTNKLFVMTQLGSVSNQASVCLIRQRLLSSALVLMSDFESLPQEGRGRNEVVAYNDLRIGFTDLAVNAIQSLQYVQMGDDDIPVRDGLAPSKYGYGFGAVSDDMSGSSCSNQESALQLLRVSLALLTRLAPTAIASGSKLGDYQTYTYGVDYAKCLKERNAFQLMDYHLRTASSIASLSYQAAHSGSATPSVALIHNNAVDIVRAVTSFFHALTDSGAMIVDILLLLIESRCFRSLIDNPLLRTSCKLWASTPPAGDGIMPGITQHRGYYTSLGTQTEDAQAKRKTKPSSRADGAHSIWREVISIFASLLRAARHQTHIYAKVDEPIVRQLTPVTSTVLDFVANYDDAIFACFSSMEAEAQMQSNMSGSKSKSSSFSSIQSSSFAFTSNLLKEATDLSFLFAELCKDKTAFARQGGGMYKRVVSTSLELITGMSSFLGSIGTARELFLALSSASGNLSNPAAMFDAHPLLADGIPNARHEAIRNAHFAHSCCILATADDFTNSHAATTKAAESSGSGKSLEQSFQIQVNNKLITENEEVAGRCLFNALSVVSNTHPASDSFISFSSVEASRLDVAAVINPGTTVAISTQAGSQQYQRYAQSSGGDVKYGRATGCDRSTHTISVEYDSGKIDRHVPWSWIVGMEDTSKRHCAFSYSPASKSISAADSRGQPSLGHLILALRWCRHVGLASLDPDAKHCSLQLTKCVGERAAILLCTEVLLHDELRGSLRDDNTRRLEGQLLDIFDYDDPESTGGLDPRATTAQQGDKSMALILGEDIHRDVRKNLKRHLLAASVERDEEQKIWEQNQTGWDGAFWGGGAKRQGRRSPFRLTRKTSSGDLS